jgi:hypothetical protein
LVSAVPKMNPATRTTVTRLLEIGGSFLISSKYSTFALPGELVLSDEELQKIVPIDEWGAAEVSVSFSDDLA